MIPPSAEVDITPSVESTEKISVVQNSRRARTTLSLSNLSLKQDTPEVRTEIKEEVKAETVRRTSTHEQIRSVWKMYCELRKEQVAEFHLLNRDFEIKDHAIILTLTNSVEEPLLFSMRPSLLSFLRDKLGNPGIQLEYVMREFESRKVVYTNKEKFEYLSEKNPLLKILKNRLGLDPEF